jgi:hypothetical protein
MKKFKNIRFSNLPNEAHYEFFIMVCEKLDSAGTAVLAVISALVIQLKVWLAKESDLMTWVRKSELTAQIEEQDRILDRSLSAFLSNVETFIHSSDPTIAGSAVRLQIMIKSYGRISKKKYEAQLGDMEAVMLNLYHNYQADVLKITGLSDRRTELQAAFNKLKTLLDERDQTHKKPDDKFPDVRKGIEGVYREITALVDANALIDSDPGFAALIDSLNPEIERLNREFHKARHDIKNANPDTIPDQPYTGEPICPTPRVFYTFPATETKSEKTIALELGRDFDVSYKNNIKAGTAYLMLHGKGAYKGSKTVSFMIAGDGGGA